MAASDDQLNPGQRVFVVGGSTDDDRIKLIGDAFLPTASEPTRRQALQSVLTEWTSPRRYEYRVSALEDFVTTRVVDDGAWDVLVGGGGDDWFIAGLATDLVLDARRNEVISRPRG